MNTLDQNREGMQHFFKLANAHDVDGVASMVHDDYVGEWKDGMIKRAWYYWDTGTLMRQLGVSA